MGQEVYSLAFRGNIESLRKKFEADPQAFSQSMNLVKDGYNALGAGIIKSNVTVIEFLLSKKPDIYAKLGLDQNVLHQAVTAVRYGINPQEYPEFKVDLESSIKIFELILKHEKEYYPARVDLLLDMKNQFGRTPMYQLSKLVDSTTVVRLERIIEKYRPGYVEQFKKQQEEAERKFGFNYKKTSVQLISFSSSAPTSSKTISSLGSSFSDSFFSFWDGILNRRSSYQAIGDDSDISLFSEKLSGQKLKPD